MLKAQDNSTCHEHSGTHIRSAHLRSHLKFTPAKGSPLPGEFRHRGTYFPTTTDAATRETLNSRQPPACLHYFGREPELAGWNRWGARQSRTAELQPHRRTTTPSSTEVLVGADDGHTNPVVLIVDSSEPDILLPRAAPSIAPLARGGQPVPSFPNR